jgi:hypothetical protein
MNQSELFVDMEPLLLQIGNDPEAAPYAWRWV